MSNVLKLPLQPLADTELANIAIRSILASSKFKDADPSTHASLRGGIHRLIEQGPPGGGIALRDAALLSLAS